MINRFYSNSNILNIPRELYKKEGSNNIFRASSLLFGSNYQTSFKKSVNTYESNRVANFISFLKSSLDSINSFSSNASKKTNNNLFDYNTNDTNSIFDADDNFKASNNPYDTVSSFKNFVYDMNYFLDTSAEYSAEKKDNLNILNKQIENDLIENKEELLYFGISVDEDNRLKLDKEKLERNLEDADRLSEIASKEDSVFNKISSRTEKVLGQSVAKYIPSESHKDNRKEITLFNYLNTSEKSPLNNAITSGNIIDYTF